MRRLGGEIRQRKHLKVIQELDAFPKVPESYQKTTASGGTVTILTFLFITILVISELQYYRATDIQYNYEVDTDLDSKLQINVDVTVAMRCEAENLGKVRFDDDFEITRNTVFHLPLTDIGADVLDLAGSTINIDSIKQQETYFELDENQKEWLRKFQKMKSTNEGYRTINEVELFEGSFPTAMPERSNARIEDHGPDSCRFSGSFDVNKVAGNFHFIVGKSIPHPRGHAHLSAFVQKDDYNFTHRINQLSFGPRVPGLISALDGDVQVTDKHFQMYHYYVKVVPTGIKMLKWAKELKTNQYSVTQRAREINHASGSHGVAGIFFKYDLSSFMVRVTEVHRPFWQFLVRLCGIVGGIFATSGMLHSLVGLLVDTLYCRFLRAKGVRSEPIQSSPSVPTAVVPEKSGPDTQSDLQPAIS